MNNERTDPSDISARRIWRARSRNPYDPRRMSRAEVIGEALWLNGTDTHTGIAHRLGFETLQGFHAYLRRAGRADLITVFTPLSIDPTWAADQLGIESLHKSTPSGSRLARRRRRAVAA